MDSSDLLLTTYENMLGALDSWLEKAEQEGGDAVLQQRLAPDMFALARQVRFLCNLPGETLARVSDVSFASSEEDDMTLAAARERIARTRKQVAGWHGTRVQGASEMVQLALPVGLIFDLDTAAYLRDWALPQFYFHLVTAYAILRAAGVPLGKADYVGYMFRYLRQPPAG